MSNTLTNRLSMRDRFLSILAGKVTDRIPLMVYEGIGAKPERVLKAFPGEVGLMRWVRCFNAVTPNCPRTVEEILLKGKPGLRVQIRTAQGVLTQERLQEPEYAEAAVSRAFIQDPADYDALLCFLRDVQVTPNLQLIETALAELGENGIVHCAVPRTPYQQLLTEWVDPDDLNWHLLDPNSRVHDCIQEMTRILLDIFAILDTAPVPYVVFPDNLNAPQIGRTFFKKYCLPVYNALAVRLADRGIPVFVGATGELKQLWYDIEDSYIGGLEGINPALDTPVEEAVSMWDDRVLGFTLEPSTFLKPRQIVYQKTREILDASGNAMNVFLQVTEPLPPGRWTPSFQAMTQAVRDHAEERDW